MQDGLCKPFAIGPPAPNPLRSTGLIPAIRPLLSGEAAAGQPALSRAYPSGFAADDAYKASLPDIQNGPESLIKGAKAQIQHVGISNFRLPIRFRTRAGGDMTLETSVTGTVSLEAEKKGINMSRIMRSFYAHASGCYSCEVIERALDAYKADLESFDARIQMRFSYPLTMRSLAFGNRWLPVLRCRSGIGRASRNAEAHSAP